jgi:hypothetical protein
MTLPDHLQDMPPEDRWRTHFDGSIPRFSICDDDASNDSNDLFFVNTNTGRSLAWQERMNKAAILAASAPYMYYLLQAIDTYISRQEFEQHRFDTLPPELTKAISDELHYAQFRFIRPYTSEAVEPSERDKELAHRELRHNTLLTNRARVALEHLVGNDLVAQRTFIEVMLMHAFTDMYGTDKAGIVEKAETIEAGLAALPMLGWAGPDRQRFNHQALLYDMQEIVAWIRDALRTGIAAEP